MAEPERGICVFDLDHTLLHMLKEEDMPAEVGDVTEDVVGFSYQGVDYSIALRVGTTSLVVEAIADGAASSRTSRPSSSRDKGGKSLKDLGLSRPRVVIFDDSINVRRPASRAFAPRSGVGNTEADTPRGRPTKSPQAWVAEDQEFVFTADRFDVNAMASAIQADDGGEATMAKGECQTSNKLEYDPNEKEEAPPELDEGDIEL
ncbi:hypothetical protein JL720_16509 [Aureococcus anophagefferens]|nr:hypothetical protein JL720_16509 [Aureococcus anophagefferens]